MEKAIRVKCECGKSVPSCTICLNPIGILNPYHEIKNKASVSGVGAFGGMGVISNDNQSNIQLKRELEMWFIWC